MLYEYDKLALRPIFNLDCASQAMFDFDNVNDKSQMPPRVCHASRVELRGPSIDQYYYNCPYVCLVCIA